MNTNNSDNNILYRGDLVNGLKNGKGALYFRDGRIIYEGEFKNDLFEGTGKFYFSDGH